MIIPSRGAWHEIDANKTQPSRAHFVCVCCIAVVGVSQGEGSRVLVVAGVIARFRISCLGPRPSGISATLQQRNAPLFVSPTQHLSSCQSASPGRARERKLCGHWNFEQSLQFCCIHLKGTCTRGVPRSLSFASLALILRALRMQRSSPTSEAKAADVDHTYIPVRSESRPSLPRHRPCITHLTAKQANKN